MVSSGGLNSARLIGYSVRNRVSDSLRLLVKFTNDLRMQRLRAEYPVSLAEFKPPLETML